MLQCSHILCKVHNIKDAVRRYRALGFTLEWGSTEERAHNALIWFEEGPFIELFELPRQARFLRWPLGLIYGAAAGERLTHWASSEEGFCDVAVEPAVSPRSASDPIDLRAIRTVVREAGVRVSRVVRGRRRRPDGEIVRYRFFALAPAGLPFVVSAYDPPQRPRSVTHTNGARGVAYVRVGVSTADRPSFDALFGSDKCLRAEPAERTGVLEVTLAGLSSPLAPELTHGARFAAAPAQGEWRTRQ